MNDLYKCPICKQVHSDGGNCYSNAVKRIRQLEDAINKIIAEWETIQRYDTILDSNYEESIKVTEDVRKVINYFLKDLEALEDKE